MTYYIYIENEKINGSGTCACLNEEITNFEVTEEVYNAFVANPDKYIWDGSDVVENPNYEQEQAEKEQARIQELYMTRSDFFDATIRAFGADEDDLLTAIGGAIMPMSLDDTNTKIALNNYKNALNFYRKHPLFTMLSNVPIKISDDITITITSDQWDKFFDETDKGNDEAYKELLPTE